jgi:hypothetical protein
MVRKDKETLIGDLEVLRALHLLPDAAALTPEEAAVLLRLSVTTLERLRKGKSGPAYIQGGTKGAKGTNQKITYLKGDLLSYQQSLKVQSSMAAAVRKGQAFLLPYANPIPKRSDFDLVTKRPFYMVSGELEIYRCVLNVSMSEFITNLGERRIAWLNPVHAAMLNWADSASKAEYVEEIQCALEQTMKILKSM